MDGTPGDLKGREQLKTLRAGLSSVAPLHEHGSFTRSVALCTVLTLAARPLSREERAANSCTLRLSMRRCALAFCESWWPWRPFADEDVVSSRTGVTSAGITSEGGQEDEPVEENAEDEEGCSVPPAVKGDDDGWRWKLRGVLQGCSTVTLQQEQRAFLSTFVCTYHCLLRHKP